MMCDDKRILFSKAMMEFVSSAEQIGFPTKDSKLRECINRVCDILEIEKPRVDE